MVSKTVWMAWSVVAVVAMMVGGVAQAVTVTSLADDFSAPTIDASKWTVIPADFEAGTGTYTADTTTNPGQLTIAGVNDISSYWGGAVVQSVDTFASNQATLISVDRTSLAGSGTAYRSSLWIKQTDGTYLHFAQNRGENGWQYNPNNTGGGTNIPLLDPLDGSLGPHEMQFLYLPQGGSRATIAMLVDGSVQAGYTFGGGWENGTDFSVRLSGMARQAPGDTVSAAFDNFSAQTIALAPTQQVKQQTSIGFAVSSTDLLEGRIPTVSGNINPEEGVTTNNPAALTNGAFGDPSVSAGNMNEIVAVHNDTTLTYDLDLSAAPFGYAITGIDTYSGWRDGGRDAQDYLVSLSYVDNPSLFEFFDIVNDNPGGLNPSDLAVFLTSQSGGPLATGVAGIRFSFPGGQENGWVGYREIDVHGFAMQDVIPEPCTAALVLIGLGALVRRRRRAG